MIKGGIINAELKGALAMARHGDAIVILDANMPVPKGVEVIDISLIRGLPDLITTLKSVLGEVVCEKCAVFELMPQYNETMYRQIAELIPQIPVETISKDGIMCEMERAKAVIRTGDFGSCCTLVLYSASGMDKYVEKFDCHF